MRILKIVLVVLILFISVALIGAYFMPKEYAVQREITINKPVDTIFNYLKFLKNQNEFSYWASIDPKMKTSYKGTDGAIGSIASWESKVKEVGVGEQEITKIIEGERIDFALRFKEPMEDTAHGFMSTEKITQTQTKVKWAINGIIPYPMNIMMPMMNLDSMLGNDLQKGLDNLKAKMEN